MRRSISGASPALRRERRPAAIRTADLEKAGNSSTAGTGRFGHASQALSARLLRVGAAVGFGARPGR